MTRRTRIPRPLAIVIGLLLVIGGGGLLSAAALSGGETFLGLQRGDPLYTERSLSAETATLAVHVREVVEDARPQAVEGALIKVYQWTRDGAEPEARSQTNEDGAVRFELHPGRYTISVEHEDAAGRHALAIQEDTRLSAIIDEEGKIHFHSTTRGHMRDHGPQHSLFVRVGEFDDETRSRQSVEDAVVQIYTYTRDGSRGEPVARNETDERGGAGFYLGTGRYLVTVETPEGDSTAFRLGLDQDKSAFVMFHPDGEARVVVNGEPEEPTRDRERSSPEDRDGRPQRDALETRSMLKWKQVYPSAIEG